MGANLVLDLEQQSPEWFEMRKGVCTGSMVKNACARMKTQPKLTKKCQDGKHGTCDTESCNCPCHGPRPDVLYMQCREDYMIDLVTTRLTGRMSDRYVSKAMEEGIERESLAIAAYEKAMGWEVDSIGFAFHPTIQWYGCSPDGLIGSDFVLEAKCPTASTHLRYILEAQKAKANGIEYVPEEYLPQIKAEIACTERPVCHFISYNPDFPKHLQLLICEWRRDKEMIEAQDAEVIKFLAETAELAERLKNMRL